MLPVERTLLRVCYLGNAQSIHTQRWARHFSRIGWEVCVISFQPGEVPGVRTIQVPGGNAISSHRYPSPSLEAEEVS